MVSLSLLVFFITGAKIVNYFELSKKNAVLGRFFVWRIGNYFRNVVNLLRRTVNFFRRQDELIWRAILTKCTFWRQGVVSEFSRSSVGVLSVELEKV